MSDAELMLYAAVAAGIPCAAGFLVAVLFGASGGRAASWIVVLAGLAAPFVLLGGFPSMGNLEGQWGAIFWVLMAFCVLLVAAAVWACFRIGVALGLVARRAFVARQSPP